MERFDLVRPRAAAAFLGLSTSTLAKLRGRGDGPPFSKIGRAVVYDPADLKAWVHARRRLSTSDTTPRSASDEASR